jgi:hypothetical protein
MVSSISRILAETTASLWIVGQKQSSSSSSSSSVASSSFQKVSNKLTSSPISTKKEEINKKRRSLQAGSRRSFIIMTMRFFVVKILVCFIVGLISFITLFYAICSPPLHLFYDVAPSAGPSSVYIPVRIIFVIIYNMVQVKKAREGIANIFLRPSLYIVLLLPCHAASSLSSSRRRVQAFWDFGFILGI